MIQLTTCDRGLIILRDVSSGRIDNIENLLSPNASDSFRQEIKQNIQGKSIEYVQDITDVKQPSPNQVRMSGKYTGKGNGWSVSGGSIYFIFERINGDWYLLESDFAKKLSPMYVVKFIGIIFLFAIPLLAFWLWMLIDIIIKPIKSKFLWIMILLMFNWMGAVIYFFTARRRYIKSLKYYKNMNKKIIEYLEQNKEQYSKNALVKQLKKAGFSEKEIEEGEKIVYNNKKK